MNKLRSLARLKRFLKWLENAYLLTGAMVFGAILILSLLSAVLDGGKVFNGCDMIWWCHLATP